MYNFEIILVSVYPRSKFAVNKERIKKVTPAIETAHEMLLEALIHKFGSVPENIEKRVRAIDNKDRCKNLLHEVLECHSIDRLKEVLFESKRVSGRSGLYLKQNYDFIVKWIAEQFRGKTLEIFDVKTEPIIDVCQFEPVMLRTDTGKLDLVMKDKGGAVYHLEEQRNMKIDDLHRFAVYHFQGAQKWGENITDIILMSGKAYAGRKEIKTKSGTYSPKIIDLTEKDGKTRLKTLKEEINAGDNSNLIELIFVPLYGKESAESRSRLAVEVLDYEIELLKKEKVMDNLVMATIIMVNKIVDKALLKKIYEEVKHMLDILEIAMEDGVAKGRQEGRQEGRLEGEQNKAFQMARMLKHDGVNISTISRASGLSAEELTRL